MNPITHGSLFQTITGLTLKSQWDKLINERSDYDQRWLDYAGWTLPHIYMEDEEQSSTEMQHDYQSLGAQVTNHLANKIATVLFQPGRPFFRLDLSDEQMEAMIEQGMNKPEVQELLSQAEKEGMKVLSRAKLRSTILTAIKSLIILGNALLYFPDGRSNVLTSQLYSLKDYVIQRDMSGEVVQIITQDTHNIETLPADIRALVDNHIPAMDRESRKTVKIYTCILRTEQNKFIVWQEIDNLFRVPRQIGTYAKDDLPWIPLTWNLARGRNYGTGLVEEYAGDFYTYSSLAEAMINLSSIAADIKVLVDPMGSTDVDSLNDSDSGSYVYGSADDISYLQLEKFQDLQFMINQMEVYARRIGAGFLFNSAVTRDAERVTAEEIRMQAQELEGSLGGVYSRLAEDMQLPIAKRAMRTVGDVFKDVEPTIITGVESLSRTSELDQIMLFFADLARLSELPPEAAKRLDYQGIITTLGAARQVDYKDFLLDEDTVRKNDERAAQLAAAERMNPNQPQPQPEMI